MKITLIHAIYYYEVVQYHCVWNMNHFFSLIILQCTPFLFKPMSRHRITKYAELQFYIFAVYVFLSIITDKRTSVAKLFFEMSYTYWKNHRHTRGQLIWKTKNKHLFFINLKIKPTLRSDINSKRQKVRSIKKS